MKIVVQSPTHGDVVIGELATEFKDKLIDASSNQGYEISIDIQENPYQHLIDWALKTQDPRSSLSGLGKQLRSMNRNKATRHLSKTLGISCKRARDIIFRRNRVRRKLQGTSVEFTPEEMAKIVEIFMEDDPTLDEIIAKYKK